MKLILTSDSNVETGVGDIDFRTPQLEAIRQSDYGPGVRAIGIILMCRSPHLNFHRRIRFHKKDRFFGIDVMLDYYQMRDASHETRCRLVAQKLLDEIPAIITKRNFSEFDTKSFIRDFMFWIQSLDCMKK